MQTIVWDVDDVLNDLMRSWLETFWLPTHTDTRVRYDDLVENPPHRLLGISEEQYLDSLDEFRVSELAANMAPNEDVAKWFHLHGNQFRHIALTARPSHTVPAIADWVFRHFGAHVRLFGFVSTRSRNADEPVYDANKAEFLRWLKQGDVFIDDSERNVQQARELGLEGFVFPQPWNQSRALHPSDILHKLTALRMART